MLHRLEAAHERSRMLGWDFSALDGRLIADDPPWDFREMCVEAMAAQSRTLDMGTGGGEFLLTLMEHLGTRRPAHMSATEGWEPNVLLSRKRLEPFGIEVVGYDSEVDESMPFEADSFDVVVARHESYDADEVARVLRQGGLFLTQQVHGRDAEELRTWFGGHTAYPDATLEHHVAAAQEAGLAIEAQQEWSGHMHFSDAQTLVEYMALVPWDVPGFRVAEHLDTMVDLDAIRPIVVTQGRFCIAARKENRLETVGQ